MSIKKPVLPILFTSLLQHPFSTEHLATEISKVAQPKLSSCQHVSTKFRVCFQDVILCLPPSSQANVSAAPKAAETLLKRQMVKENTTAFFYIYS